MSRVKKKNSIVQPIMSSTDEEENLNMRQFIVQYVDKFFVNHIPMESLKELSPVYMYTFGAFAYMVAIAIFVYFVVQNYNISLNQAFISLDSTSGICNSVPISITGTYLADNKGNWIGSPDFAYSSALYSLSFNNFEVQSYSQYQQMMSAFNNTLQVIGKIAEYQDLPTNLIFWTAFQRYYSVEYPTATNFSSIGFGQLQTLQMTGSPADMFDLTYQQGTIGSQRGFCNIETGSSAAGTYFDQANAAMVLAYSHSQYIASPICKTASAASSLGYISTFDGDLFSIKLDVRSFMTAMSVNMKIHSIENLAVANSQFKKFEAFNTSFLLGQYYDVRYPQMAPLLCVQNTTFFNEASIAAIIDNYNGEVPFTSLCFYIVGNTVTLPIFNHFGISKEVPEMCTCSSHRYHAACDQFNFMTSLLFYPVTKSTTLNPSITLLNNLQIIPQVRNLITLVVSAGTYRQLNADAYNASWAGAAVAFNQTASFTKSTSWLKKQFSFCDKTVANVALSCSLIVFNSYNPNDLIVSEYKYQLRNGSCRDSFTIPDQYWEKLVNNPPVALAQNYYECFSSKRDALLNAVGVAMGNTSLAVPFVVFLCLPIIYILLVIIQQVPPPAEYSKDEKDQALETFATLLLRMRDGKTRGIKQKGVLISLTKELIIAAKQEAGFPDSDDEESDDEDENEEGADQHDGIKTDYRNGNERYSVGNNNAKSRPKSNKEHSSPSRGGVNGARSGSAISTSVLRREADSDDESDEEQGGRSSRANKGEARMSERPSKARASKTRRSSMSKPMLTHRNHRSRQRMGVFTKQLTVTDEHESHKPKMVILGKIMSGLIQQNRETLNGQELVEVNQRQSTYNIQLLFRDLSSGQCPPDIHILNTSSNRKYPSKSTKRVSGAEIVQMVDDLTRLFSNAANILHMKSDQSLSKEELYDIAKKSEYFEQGYIISEKLIRVDFDEFMGGDDISLLFKLSNALCLHACIELRCEINQVEEFYKEKVGYNVGGRLVTIDSLSQIMQ